MSIISISLWTALITLHLSVSTMLLLGTKKNPCGMGWTTEVTPHGSFSERQNQMLALKVPLVIRGKYVFLKTSVGKLSIGTTLDQILSAALTDSKENKKLCVVVPHEREREESSESSCEHK